MDRVLRAAARRVLPASVYRAVVEAVAHPRLEDIDRRLEWLSRAVATQLYPQLEPAKSSLAQSEIKVYSQHGEDGILLWLFSVIGPTDRRFVEFGIEDGRQCNTANLSLHWGWTGLLIEADEAWSRSARNYYDQQVEGSVSVEEAVVTPSNINSILDRHGLAHTFDLLSIDIDSYDYWVWKAITAVPRVVVIEYNASFGPTRSVTLPFDPSVHQTGLFRRGLYHGASLTALTRLAKVKGYELVGCESAGANAFFVRGDCLSGLVPVKPETAWRPPSFRSAIGTIAEQQALIADLPLVEV